MKPISALTLAILAGGLTFAVQHELFPPRLHAAALMVPQGANWRQQMIDDYPGGPKVEHALSRITGRLDLSAVQQAQLRPILQRNHDQILALLLTGPPTMTREQFVVQEQQIWGGTRAKLDALLTPDQRELAQQTAPAKS